MIKPNTHKFRLDWPSRDPDTRPDYEDARKPEKTTRSRRSFAAAAQQLVTYVKNKNVK